MDSETLKAAWLSGERLSAWRTPDAARGVVDISRSSLPGVLLLRWEAVRGVPADVAARAVEVCGELAAPTDDGAWMLGWLEYEGVSHGLTDEDLKWGEGSAARARCWDAPLNVTLLWRVLALEVATARCPRAQTYNDLARVRPGDVPWLVSASLSMGPPSGYDGDFYVTLHAKTSREQLYWSWQFFPLPDFPGHQHGSSASISVYPLAAG